MEKMENRLTEKEVQTMGNEIVARLVHRYNEFRTMHKEQLEKIKTVTVGVLKENFTVIYNEPVYTPPSPAEQLEKMAGEDRR